MLGSNAYLKARLGGVFLLVLGLGLAYWFHHVYEFGGEIYEKLLVMTPMLILAGLAYMVEPRIALAAKNNGPALPGVFKALNYIILIVGIAIGFYVRFTLFGAWHR